MAWRRAAKPRTRRGGARVGAQVLDAHRGRAHRPELGRVGPQPREGVGRGEAQRDERAGGRLFLIRDWGRRGGMRKGRQMEGGKLGAPRAELTRLPMQEPTHGAPKGASVAVACAAPLVALP